MAKLPPTLENNPSLDRWVAVREDGTLIIRTGKAELGQGIKTAMALIAADELDIDPARITVETADTRASPNEFITAGSMSIETSGAALRQAAAQARAIILEHAAALFGVAVDDLEIEDGQVSHPGANRKVTFAEAMGGKSFGAAKPDPVPEKDPERYRWVGRSMTRVDLRAKVEGAPVFVHDMELPHRLHARLVRPPTPWHRLGELDAEKIEAQAGVHKLIRMGSFLAVTAEREEDAVRAAESCREAAAWTETGEVPQTFDWTAHLRAQPSRDLPVVDGTAVEETVPTYEPSAEEVQELRASYSRPYQMHGSIGPSAAMALYEEGRLTIWSHSQGVEVLKAALLPIMGFSEDQVDVIHVQGAGCYGHNGADDAGLEAAFVARELEGRPVLLKWSRADEHKWEPYGPAMQIELRGGLDADGRICGWRYDVWSYPHAGRPRPDKETSGFLSTWHFDPPMKRPAHRPSLFAHVGSHRNADPLYALRNKQVVKHSVASSPLRTSSMRGLGAYANVFAIESFMDELAVAAGKDPAAFRLAHLEDSRAKAVITRAGEMAARAPVYAGEASEKTGRGLGFAQYKNQQCYVAIVAELTVDEESAEVRLRNAWMAADAGRVIDADGLKNQLEGGLVQGASWTLKEEVAYGPEGVTSTDWQSYPILTFAEIPEIETELIDHPHERALGAGEASQGPIAAAIANAVYDAVGLRLRDLPFTPERVRAAASR